MVHAVPRIDPERWLEEHGDVLYRFALLRTGDPDTAEDLVQDTLLAAWRNHASYRGDASERTWLTGILRHKIADRLRGAAGSFNADAGAGIEEGLFRADGTWRTAPGSWGEEPISDAQAEAFMDAVAGCLGELAPNQRSCFVLRELDDVDTEEASRQLGVSAGHLYVLLHRARLALRRCLELHWFSGGGTP